VTRTDGHASDMGGRCHVVTRISININNALTCD